MTQKNIKVVKIINSKQIVINAGTDDGVTEGQLFRIVSPDKNAESVIDPDTGENLGTLNLVKAKVVITTAYSKMSIVEAPERKISGYSMINPADTIIKNLTGERYIRPDLNIDPTEITGGLPNSDKTIKIGDLAIPED